MMNRTNIWAVIGTWILTVVLYACAGDDKPKKSITDTLTSGTISVAFDENYQPVMEQQLKIFDSSFPDAQLQVRYLPQEDCFDLLMRDSVRMIVAARDLNDAEKEYLKQNKIHIRSVALARDAVAVIVNPASPDADLNRDMLVNILLNQYSRQYDIVFDNKRSGIVKYMQEQLIPGKEFGSNIYALQTTDSVIKYVAAHKNAIGFVAVGHLYGGGDRTGNGKFRDNVQVVAIKSDSLNEMYEPYQANLFDGHYPLTRTLYFHLRESHRGLGTGLANFLGQERGQAVFRLEHMLPLRVPLIIRDVILK